MKEREPHSAEPFQLERLTDDELEELTFLLARQEDRRVVRMRAPDGGLDTVLPDEHNASRATRGWQAKRHTRRIDFTDCERSLDRAADVWKPSRVTFTFPRTLTRGDHEKFTKRLGRRHPDVAVDYWSGGELSARLMADEAGERIARRFFGDRDPIAVMERALRAGGELSRGDHVLDREFAVEEFVQGDPHFAWAIYKRPTGTPEPQQTPGAILRLEFRRGEDVLLADALPRSASSLEHYGPGVTLVTDDSPAGADARRMIADLLAGGGRLRLREGVKLAVDRLPAPFGDLIDSPIEGDITVKMVSDPAPWYAQLTADTDLGRGEQNVDLLPQPPPDDWDAELQGASGGLTTTVRFRWSVNTGVGEINFGFRYRASEAPVAERASALSFVLATHGAGALRILDRNGHRDPIEERLPRRRPPQELVELDRLLNALVEIERFTGSPTPAVPEEVKLREIDDVVWLGEALRNRGYSMRMTSLTARVAADGAGAFRTGSDITLSETFVGRLFGHELPLAERVVQLPLMTVTQRRRLPGEDAWEVVLAPLHSHEAEVWAELRPLKAQEDAQGDPSRSPG